MSDYSLSDASETDNVYSQTSIDDDDYDPDATTDDEQSTTNTKTPRRFSKNSKHPKRFCFRCGRTGHFVGSCYAKTRPDGTRLPRGRLSDSNPSPAKKQRPSPGIYLLQDPTGCIYVGKSNDRAARIRQHRAGQGTSFLTGELTELPPYTSGSINDLETWERNETLSAMYLKGIDQVRGWIFTSNTLTPIEKRHAFQQVCEKFDLCRKCGRHTHFANECRSKTVAYWAE